MTSRKYYGNWLKEAGRGHVAAFFTWTGFFVYLASSILQLNADTASTFYGIGSPELFYLCAGLGTALAAVEFFYLLQPVKLDFYYSLPVRRGTVFWCRYVHGLIQFYLPFTLAMAVCGIFQSSRDTRFLPFAGSYTVHSICFLGAVFLLFYHIGMLAFLMGGKIVSVLLLLILQVFLARLVLRGICGAYATDIFKAFYRIPLLEELEQVLAPGSLAGKLAGMELFEKQEVLEYVPEGTYLAAAALWLVLSFCAAVSMQKKRRAEGTGRAFVFPVCGRVVLFLLVAASALGTAGFLLGLSGEEDKSAGDLLLFLAGTGFLAVLIHLPGEWLVKLPEKRKFQWRGQMLAEAVFVCLVQGIFFWSAPSFDLFFPEDGEVEAAALCVNGIGMPAGQFREAQERRTGTEADFRLQQYLLSGDGLEKGLSWLYDVRENEWEEAYTHVTACYHLKGGKEIYRTYPVDERSFQAFAEVYESGEYKEKAYPGLMLEDIRKDRLIYADGVADRVLGLSGEEKQELLARYKEDVGKLRMEDLRRAAPSGILWVQSEVLGERTELLIYPFFERTCRFLEEHQIEASKDIFDYPVSSLWVFAESPGGEGIYGTYAGHYEEEEELEEWRGRLVWKRLDVQPLLYPLDYSQEIKAEVEEPESGAAVDIKCYAEGF